MNHRVSLNQNCLPLLARTTACAFLTLLILTSANLSADDEMVGHRQDGSVLTPVNQVLTPMGKQIDLPGLRPQALALSPDGRLLLTSGKTNELIVIDPANAVIKQRVLLPAEETQTPAEPPVSEQVLRPDEEGLLSYTGLIFSPSGSKIYMSNVNGSVKVFAVSADGASHTSNFVESSRGQCAAQRG